MSVMFVSYTVRLGGGFGGFKSYYLLSCDNRVTYNHVQNMGRRGCHVIMCDTPRHNTPVWKTIRILTSAMRLFERRKSLFLRGKLKLEECGPMVMCVKGDRCVHL
jgi:hypothetical protein